MKRIVFRLTVAILTFFVGVASTKLPPRQLYLPNTFNINEQTFSIPEPKKVSNQSHTFNNLIKVADVPSDVERDTFSVQTLNEKEIWISSREKMWRTRNGGKNWGLVFDGGKGQYSFDNGIMHYQFINSKVGWILQFKAEPSAMLLYKTEDGGDTWRIISRHDAENFNAFQFLDEKHGWAAGTLVKRIPKNETRFIRPRNIYNAGKEALYGAIYYTEDGGKTWRQQPVPSRPNSIIDISMFDAKHGWAWGDAGDFYLDNGRWREINYNETKCGNRRAKVKHLEIDAGNPPVQAASVSFISPKVGWMSHTEGYLAKTTDGGRTWCDLINPEDLWGKQEIPEHYFYGLKFNDSLHGYGYDEESLYETKDGGATWKKTDFGMEEIGFYFVDARHIWAVSKEGLFRVVPEGQLDTSEAKPNSSTDADYYAHLKLEHREVLREWLKAKPYLRPAVEEFDDYIFQEKDKSNFEDNLKFLRDTLGENTYQYYAVGDMNHDGKEDFAVLLVDTRKQEDEIDHFALAIFNAPFKKGQTPAYYEEGLAGISNSYLIFDKKEKNLFLGMLESDVLCATYYPKGKTYYFKDCMG